MIDSNKATGYVVSRTARLSYLHEKMSYSSITNRKVTSAAFSLTAHPAAASFSQCT